MICTATANNSLRAPISQALLKMNHFFLNRTKRHYRSSRCVTCFRCPPLQSRLDEGKCPVPRGRLSRPRRSPAGGGQGLSRQREAEVRGATQGHSSLFVSAGGLLLVCRMSTRHSFVGLSLLYSLCNFNTCVDCRIIISFSGVCFKMF